MNISYTVFAYIVLKIFAHTLWVYVHTVWWIYCSECFILIGKVLLVQQVAAPQVAHFALKRITLECSVSIRRIRLESKCKFFTIYNKKNNRNYSFYLRNTYYLYRGPVAVMVFSVLFIACVFLLHFWGKFTRGWWVRTEHRTSDWTSHSLLNTPAFCLIHAPCIWSTVALSVLFL